MNTQKVVLYGGLLLLLSCLITVVYRMFAGKSTTDGQVHANAVYIVVAGWCPHCQRAEPEFKRFTKLMRASYPDIHVQTIDTASASRSEEKVVKELGVRGFPTVVFTDGSKAPKVYSGARTAGAMMSYARQFFGR